MRPERAPVDSKVVLPKFPLNIGNEDRQGTMAVRRPSLPFLGVLLFIRTIQEVKLLVRAGVG